MRFAPWSWRQCMATVHSTISLSCLLLIYFLLYPQGSRPLCQYPRFSGTCFLHSPLWGPESIFSSLVPRLAPIVGKNCPSIQLQNWESMVSNLCELFHGLAIRFLLTELSFILPTAVIEMFSICVLSYMLHNSSPLVQSRQVIKIK